MFTDLDARGRGAHDVRDAGAAGELTGGSRAWQFGDEQPLDVVRTVRNAVLRMGGGPLRLAVEDFEVAETERRTTAAVALLVDLSFSMELRDRWGPAKQTTMALHSLVTTQFPQDAIEIIGFSDYAQVLRPEQLAGLDPQRVQGTNLQHALMLAGRFLAKHPLAEPVVMVVTDGEPTAHLTADGYAEFCWPPLPETLELTMAEVERLTRRGATINVFMLDDEPRLMAFVERAGAAQRRPGFRVRPRPARRVRRQRLPAGSPRPVTRARTDAGERAIGAKDLGDSCRQAQGSCATLHPRSFALQERSSMNPQFGRFGGKVGLLLVAIGMVVIGIAYNSVASQTSLLAQMPYLVSGGLIGISLVIVGAAVLVVNSAREDRALLEAKLDDLTDALLGATGGTRTAHGFPSDASGLVVAGTASFHTPDCRLVDGREETTFLTAEEATRTASRPAGSASRGPRRTSSIR